MKKSTYQGSITRESKHHTGTRQCQGTPAKELSAQDDDDQKDCQSLASGIQKDLRKGDADFGVHDLALKVSDTKGHADQEDPSDDTGDDDGHDDAHGTTMLSILGLFRHVRG